MTEVFADPRWDSRWTEPPAPPPPRPPRWRPARPRATGRELLLVVVVGVVVDSMLHSRLAGLAGAGAVGAAAVALVVSGRVRSHAAAAMAALAVPVGAILAVRSAWWVVLPVAAAASTLLAASASFGSGGRLASQDAWSLIRRAGRVLGSGIDATAFLVRGGVAAAPSAPGRRRAVPVLRGALVAGPILLVLGALLASADPVFASYLRLPFDVDELGGHLAGIALGALAMAALIREAARPPLEDAAAHPGRVGVTEALVLLGGLVALYGLFALAQVQVAFGGADVVRRAGHLTRAEYARQGFFQLVAVSAITLGVLLAVRALVRPGTRRQALAFTAVGEAAVALTLVIVAVALVRLRLYDDAYGLTALRFAVIATTVWIGAVFVLVGAALLRPVWHRNWLLPAIVASALLGTVLTAAADPEAVIARHNLEVPTAEGTIDAAYLASLSDDAVPDVVARLDRLSPWSRQVLTDALCRRRTLEGRGPAGWNGAAAEAEAALAPICPT